jgi:hypothetical protein
MEVEVSGTIEKTISQMSDEAGVVIINGLTSI